jgi:hypothetical protein
MDNKIFRRSWSTTTSSERASLWLKSILYHGELINNVHEQGHWLFHWLTVMLHTQLKYSLLQKERIHKAANKRREMPRPDLRLGFMAVSSTVFLLLSHLLRNPSRSEYYLCIQDRSLDVFVFHLSLYMCVWVPAFFSFRFVIWCYECVSIPPRG